RAAHRRAGEGARTLLAVPHRRDDGREDADGVPRREDSLGARRYVVGGGDGRAARRPLSDALGRAGAAHRRRGGRHARSGAASASSLRRDQPGDRGGEIEGRHGFAATPRALVVWGPFRGPHPNGRPSRGLYGLASSRGATRLRRDAPKAGGFGGHFGTPIQTGGHLGAPM